MDRPPTVPGRRCARSINGRSSRARARLDPPGGLVAATCLFDGFIQSPLLFFIIYGCLRARPWVRTLGLLYAGGGVVNMLLYFGTTFLSATPPPHPGIYLPFNLPWLMPRRSWESGSGPKTRSPEQSHELILSTDSLWIVLPVPVEGRDPSLCATVGLDPGFCRDDDPISSFRSPPASSLAMARSTPLATLPPEARGISGMIIRRSGQISFDTSLASKWAAISSRVMSAPVAGFQEHHDALAEDLVGNGDGRHQRHLRMAAHRVLDGGGADILAAADNEIALAAGHAQIALGMDRDDVVHQQPAIGRVELLVGRRIIVIAAAEDRALAARLAGARIG